MNSVTLIGRLTREPEYHETETVQICRFSIAVDRPARNGEEKKTDFPRIVVFGKQAENCNKYLSKGKMVGVQGRIQTGSYEKEGQKIYTTDVIGDRVEFLSPADKESEVDFATLDEKVPF